MIQIYGTPASVFGTTIASVPVFLCESIAVVRPRLLVVARRSLGDACFSLRGYLPTTTIAQISDSI